MPTESQYQAGTVVQDSAKKRADKALDELRDFFGDIVPDVNVTVPTTVEEFSVDANPTESVIDFIKEEPVKAVGIGAFVAGAAWLIKRAIWG